MDFGGFWQIALALWFSLILKIRYVVIYSCLQSVSQICYYVFVKCGLGLVVYKTNCIDSHCSELILSSEVKHFRGISNFDNWDQMSDF